MSQLLTLIHLGIVIIFVQVFYKELLITSFDQTFAKTYGLNTQLIHYSLMLVLTLVTVSALQTVGIILVVAMLITPDNSILLDRPLVRDACFLRYIWCCRINLWFVLQLHIQLGFWSSDCYCRSRVILNFLYLLTKTKLVTYTQK